MPGLDSAPAGQSCSQARPVSLLPLPALGAAIGTAQPPVFLRPLPTHCRPRHHIQERGGGLPAPSPVACPVLPQARGPLGLWTRASQEELRVSSRPEEPVGRAPHPCRKGTPPSGQGAGSGPGPTHGGPARPAGHVCSQTGSGKGSWDHSAGAQLRSRDRGTGTAGQWTLPHL